MIQYLIKAKNHAKSAEFQLEAHMQQDTTADKTTVDNAIVLLEQAMTLIDWLIEKERREG